MEKIYFDCDRCGDRLIADDKIKNYVNYKNAVLCLKCSKIRQFDDGNPIMYPELIN